MRKDGKEKAKKIVSCIVFVGIILFLFCKVTWVFRGNALESREDILGFKNQGKVDVVLYGGSNLLRYYQPLEAWNKYGYTSYNYATSSAKADLLKSYMEESRKTNEPLLYVCDIRNITMVNEVVDDSSVRNWSDSLSPFSFERAKGITSFLFSRDWKECDIPSFYFDIIKYHSNYDSLAHPYQWEFIDTNSVHNVDKGFNAKSLHVSFDEPKKTEKRGTLTKQQENAMEELLAYCDQEKLNVLFICCPYIIPENEWEIINTCGDMIREHGYTFLNFNDYYDEIGLDFTTDFGDINHVNYLGAEKYTDYLISYLVEHYDLPDHRGDSDYAKWDEDYIRYTDLQKQWKENVTALVEDHFEARDIGLALPTISDFSKWYHSIQNNNFTVIIKKNGYNNYSNIGTIMKSFIEQYEIDMEKEYYTGIWSMEESLFISNDGEAAEVEIGVSGGRGQEQCFITSGDDAQLTIGGIDYYDPSAELQVIIYDNNYKQIVDNVRLQVDDEGEVILVR